MLGQLPKRAIYIQERNTTVPVVGTFQRSRRRVLNMASRSGNLRNDMVDICFLVMSSRMSTKKILGILKDRSLERMRCYEPCPIYTPH